MKCHFLWLFLVAVLAGLTSLTKIENQPVLHNSALLRGDGTEMNSPCLGDKEILANLQSISSGQSLSQQESAQKELIDDANKSEQCRKRIITALMSALDKPITDLQRNRSHFYLWHYGSEILATLKAEEALDLLIEHFDLHDGTPFPLNHHPALVNVIRMGSVAIPKLDAILRKNNNPNSRQYAVFCIASIGGSDAKKVLMQALTLESNDCVKSFIRASLDAFNSSRLHDEVPSERRTEWYAAFLCNTP